MFFQLPGFKNANSWALHSAMFYFLLTIRGMTVEHRIAHQYHQSKGNRSAAFSRKVAPISKFLHSLALKLIETKTTT